MGSCGFYRRGCVGRKKMLTRQEGNAMQPQLWLEAASDHKTEVIFAFVVAAGFAMCWTQALDCWLRHRS
jgi:hypothetical protein